MTYSCEVFAAYLVFAKPVSKALSTIKEVFKPTFRDEETGTGLSNLSTVIYHSITPRLQPLRKTEKFILHAKKIKRKS